MDKNIVNKLLDQPNLESSHITQLLTIATMSDDKTSEPTPSTEHNSSVEVDAGSPWVLPRKGQKCEVISHPDESLAGQQDEIPTIGSTVYISDITTMWNSDTVENLYGVLVTKRKAKPEDQTCYMLMVDNIRPI